MKSVEMKPIGVIHSPYKTKAEAPHQGKDEICQIEVFREYEEGLNDIERFTHLHVVYWLHLSSGYSLMVQTPWDAVLHGLFSTRSPHRPNPLGYAVVELLERNGNLLKVRGLDAVEGTPLLDIKPYIPNLDARPDASRGWLT
ncbi:S-adenosyl-L-methionine-binding protein [candidate division TA06 bacterium DG_26]|uniref:S-adenosyl-L-methionine-binding protein n=1 Tax=candidate division TA06 bacterium DG_26 TaxID=1703771 RepID=A0A0S7WH11_UNCT6|nr:MAG: S-adenosyl-L-methionine-binding protein [candidate division TA06 bacterium DG_26]